MGGPENDEKQEAATEEQSANILGQWEIHRANLFSCTVLLNNLSRMLTFPGDIIIVMRPAMM